MEGGLRVSWSFEHTGGVPLTSLTVNYTTSVPGGGAQEVALDATIANTPSLVAGYTYAVSIEARNSIGLSRVQCTPRGLTIGMCLCVCVCTKA